MRKIFSLAIPVVSKHSPFVIAVTLVALLQTNVCLVLAADRNSGTTISLQELIELSLDYNSKNRANKKYLPPEHITFLVKKYFYQILYLLQMKGKHWFVIKQPVIPQS